MSPLCVANIGILLTGLISSSAVGAFTLTGQIASTGEVVIAKQYLKKHGVSYVGQYDGEGTMSGTWRIGADHGE